MSNPSIRYSMDFINRVTSRASAIIKNIDMSVGTNLELSNNSHDKSQFVPLELPPKAAADSPLAINNQGHTNSSQPGLTVGTYPIGVAVNPVTKKIYITDEFSNSVSVISGTNNSVEGTITVGDFPYGVAINPFDSRVYVTNRGSDTVSVIDGSTNTKLHNITVQNSPVGVAVNPSANWIYVTNINSNIVSVIDGITDKVTANIAVGKIPYGIAVNPITKRVYVTNIGSDNVSVIDGLTNKVIANISVGKNPVGIDVNSATDTIFVTNYASNTVSVVDGKDDKETAIITVGKKPVGIAVNPSTNKAYVTNIGSNTVSVIDTITDKVTGTITVNPSLGGSYKIHDPVLSMPITAKFPLIASLVAVNDISNMVYVTNTGSNTVSIIDGNIDHVVVKISFNSNPPNSGDIQCNGQQILPNTNFLYRNSTNLTCTANADRGYKFSSWSNMLSSQSNPLSFNISQYGGTLTANFKETLSFEQYLAIILGPISIISIIVGWFLRNRQRRLLNKYMTIIDTAYESLDQNNNSKECLLHLQLVRKEISHLFKKGKISDAYYNILDKKISEYIEKVNRL
ncbi:MAG TPA: YncE family protein [Candidatus Nitrosopolaris sp.]|nr:YncE family protein [Candidatus Nitrosopolaris sp.]